jgi:SAM-dependent methyltransferase
MNDVAATIEKPPSSLYDLSDDVSRCVLCEWPGYELHQEVTHYGFPFRFSRCHCGLIKQTPMPNEAFFEWFFNSDLFLSAKRARADQVWGFYDYLKDEPCRLATSRYRYQRLGDVFRPASVSSAHSRRSTSPLRIMKIGPSTGSMLHIAKEHGHDAFGCDVSTRFIEYARETYGVTIDHGRFERLQYPAESFDVILLFNVIENVPNLDEFLRSVHRALKPNGLFVLNRRYATQFDREVPGESLLHLPAADLLRIRRGGLGPHPGEIRLRRRSKLPRCSHHASREDPDIAGMEQTARDDPGPRCPSREVPDIRLSVAHRGGAQGPSVGGLIAPVRRRQRGPAGRPELLAREQQGADRHARNVLGAATMFSLVRVA